MTTPAAPPLATARQWAEVFPVIDFDALPADGVVRSLDQIKTRPAVHWLDRWMPHYQGPDELVDRAEFERRLGAAFRAEKEAERPANT